MLASISITGHIIPANDNVFFSFQDNLAAVVCPDFLSMANISNFVKKNLLFSVGELL
jgi:hypothetical protein